MKHKSSRNIRIGGPFLTKMRRIVLVMMTALILGCQEDNIPVGLYDYQVIRLLASDSAKTWYRTQYVENGEVIPVIACEDSVFVSILLHERYPTVDSAYYYEIVPKDDCSSLDTFLIGKFAASSIDNVFTDSLNFEDGPIDFMLLDNITSRYTKLLYSRAGVNISASFEAIQ